jgi:hypothetical protein
MLKPAGKRVSGKLYGFCMGCCFSAFSDAIIDVIEISIKIYRK